jgi:hypothetical protein
MSVLKRPGRIEPVSSGGVVPGQELFDAADGMVGDLGQNTAWVEFQIEPLSLANQIRL